MTSSESQILSRVLSQIHPAHGIHAELFSRFFKPDSRAVGFVHRFALFVLNKAVSEQCAERLLVFCVVGFVIAHHGRERQHRIEPVAELAGETFGDKIGRIPPLPVLTVCVVAHGAEWHDTRVEPRIANVGDASHSLAFFAGRLAFDDHAVDPRTMRRVAFEIAPAFNAAFFEFRQRTDDFEVRRIFFVHPDWQRESPKTLFGNHPVTHVGQPVDLTFLPVDAVRQPFDLASHILDLITPVHVNEPLVDQTEDKFITGSPAVWINVRIRFDRNQHALGFELFKDKFSRCR